MKTFKNKSQNVFSNFGAKRMIYLFVVFFEVQSCNFQVLVPQITFLKPDVRFFEKVKQLSILLEVNSIVSSFPQRFLAIPGVSMDCLIFLLWASMHGHYRAMQSMLLEWSVSS